MSKPLWCLCVPVCGRMCASVQIVLRPEDGLGHYSSGPMSYSFETETLTSLDLQIRVGWLVSKSQQGSLPVWSSPAPPHPPLFNADSGYPTPTPIFLGDQASGD